jgi:hypothetical protein
MIILMGYLQNYPQMALLSTPHPFLSSLVLRLLSPDPPPSSLIPSIGYLRPRLFPSALFPPHSSPCFILQTIPSSKELPCNTAKKTYVLRTFFLYYFRQLC